MHFSIKYEDLLRAFTFIGEASKVGTDPETQSIILSTTPDGVFLSSLGITSWGTCTADAEVHLTGEVGLHGMAALKIIAALPLGMEELVDVADTGSEIEVRSQSGKRIREIPRTILSDYSGRPTWDEDLIDVSPDFCETLLTANKIAAKETDVMNLAGVHVHAGGIAATDKYQFILVDQEIPIVTAVTIPSGLLKSLPSPSSYGAGDIKFGANARSVCFDFGGSQIIGSTLATEYPSIDLIRAACPEKTTPYFMEIEVKEFREMLDALAPVGNDTTSATIYPDGTVGVVTEDNYTGHDKIDFISLEIEEPISFVINHLNQIKSLVREQDSCHFRFHNSNPTRAPFAIVKDNVIIGCMPSQPS